MKTIIGVFLLVWLSCSTSAAGLRERVNKSDVVAIVTVTNVTSTVRTNADGNVVTSFACDATLLRTLKGTPPSSFHLIGEAERSYIGQRGMTTSHFVLFLKHSDPFYAVSDSDGIVPIFGPGKPEDRVLWPHCTRLEELEATIHKLMK